MSTPAHEALDRHATPWLFATALATTAPHFIHQPPWLSAVAGATLLWAVWLWWKDQRLPSRWILIPLVGAGSAGILLEFHTLFGRDAGVAMLVMFMAMKLLELKSRRDAMVVVTLGYFLLLTHYFFSQSIPTGIWLLAAMWLVTATLIRLHGVARRVTRCATPVCFACRPSPSCSCFFYSFRAFPGRSGDCLPTLTPARQGYRTACRRVASPNLSRIPTSPFAFASTGHYRPGRSFTGADRSWSNLTARHGSPTKDVTQRRNWKACRRPSTMKRRWKPTTSAGCWPLIPPGICRRKSPKMAR